MLTRFAMGRLLFRLSQSLHADRFVLKDPRLMMIGFEDPNHGRRELDLLGFGDPSEDATLSRFRDILVEYAQDGAVFDPGTLRLVNASGQSGKRTGALVAKWKMALGAPPDLAIRNASAVFKPSGVSLRTCI